MTTILCKNINNPETLSHLVKLPIFVKWKEIILVCHLENLYKKSTFVLNPFEANPLEHLFPTFACLGNLLHMYLCKTPQARSEWIFKPSSRCL